MKDGRIIGDNANLVLDLNADQQLTPNVDRVYLLNPWPNLPGLRYTVAKGPNWTTTAILSDTKGRGAIRYVVTPEGRKIRVDSFLIPLREIKYSVGHKIRVVYYGNSPNPDLTLNSVGFEPKPPLGAHYVDYNIPMVSYHDYVLTQGGSFTATNVPDGHHDAGGAPSDPPRRR